MRARTSTSTIGTIAAAMLANNASAASGLPVLEDDFNDNMIGDLWLVFEEDPLQITVVEQNMRLEFEAAANSGAPAGAAILSDGWAIDANFDFRYTIDAHRVFDLDGEESVEDIDGAVGFGDILAVLGAWGPCGVCDEDIDGDGVVGFSDVLRILGAWGGC